ncbi:MAG: hypothetical protein QF685_12350, partial [Verrucomicrobiota bacterium]|nr:hypothetical protein [Verrucomicrobiota bacterium]
LQGKSHEQVLALLDEFIAKDADKLIKDPLKRAMMQHDLWAIFDWSANALTPLPFGGRVDPAKLATKELGAARKALRQRLAKIIPRLALGKSAIAKLPDNYGAAVQSRVFNLRFDLTHPPKHYLPEDLLDPDGSWVCVRGALPGPSAPVHIRYYRGRSPFLVLLRLPGGRQATLSFLKQLNQASARELDAKKWQQQLPLFPVGTAVALVRQMMVINRSGEITPTPIVQTAQFRVYRKVGEDLKSDESCQSVYKYVVQRAQLFDGEQGGLRAMNAKEHSGLSLLYNDDTFETKNKNYNRRSVMQSCIDCHSCGGPTVHSIFTFRQDDWVPEARAMSQNRLRLLPTSIDIEQKRAISWKSQRHDWGLLQGWLETQ